GKEDEATPDRRRRQTRQEEAGVVGMEPDVGELLLLDLREQRGEAVEEGLAADEADPRMTLRLPGQMLAAAEADLEPALSRRRREQLARIERARLRDRDPEARQQMLEQLLA